jgi:hypothetical protein
MLALKGHRLGLSADPAEQKVLHESLLHVHAILVPARACGA